MDAQGSQTGKSADDDAPERASLIAAMLAISAESGYRAATVEALLERSGVADLSTYFASLQECFAAAYEAEAERLWTLLRQARASQSGWPECLRATLTAFFADVIERPGPSRVLLVEVHVAGGSALARYEKVFERLSRALQADACRETTESRHSPPPITAEFMLGAIESSVRSYLVSGEQQRLWAALPELMQLIVGPYLGERAAAAELRRPARPPSW